MAVAEPLEIIATVSYVAVTEELVKALAKHLYDNGEEDPEFLWDDFTDTDREYWYGQAKRAIAFMQTHGAPDWYMGTAAAKDNLMGQVQHPPTAT